MLTILAIRIKDLRKEKGLSQAELGKILGVANTTISAWETDLSHPNFEDLKSLANVLETSADYLIGNTDIKEMPALQETLLKYHGREVRILHAASQTGLSEETILKIFEDLAKLKDYNNKPHRKKKKNQD